MATTTLNSKKHFGQFADMLSLIPKGSKTVSTYKKVIEITTNKKSLENSEFILKDLDESIENLPIEESQLDIEHLEKCLQVIKQNQFEVNKMFDTIDSLFDGENETTIDDPAMMQFLNNMQKAKDKLLYISEYITLVLEIQSAKKSAKKNVFTIEQFIEFIGAPELAA